MRIDPWPVAAMMHSLLPVKSLSCETRVERVNEIAHLLVGEFT